MNVTVAGQPSWATVSLVHAPVELLVAFACHHLALGAREVRMYMDHPNAKDIEFLNAIKGVHVTACDSDFWQGTFGVPRPDSFVRRQRLISTHGYRATKADWLAHIDCDEFLAPTTSVSDALAAAPADAIGLSMKNVERVWIGMGVPETIFGGSFRKHIDLEWKRMARLLGPMAAYSNGGFSAYTIGKSFTRTGQPDVSIGVHWPRPANYLEPKIADIAGTDRVLVAHFDGLTPLHFVAKMAYYDGTQQYARPPKNDRHRAAQIKFVADNHGDLAEIRRLHDMLKRIGPRKARALRDRNYLVDLDIDPVAAVSKILPKAQFDYSPAGFDRLLTKHNPRVAAIIDTWNTLLAAPEPEGETT